jgi:hypothetical protein
MKNAYIKFRNKEDHARGFSELSTRGQIIALTDAIFCIPFASLAALADKDIPYTMATEEEVTSSQRRTWRFGSTTPKPLS